MTLPLLFHHQGRGSPIGGKSQLLPFSDNFNRSNGTLGGGWTYTAGVWTISSNAAVCTPVLLDELLQNGNFANWTGDNPNNWSVSGESGTDPEVSEVGTAEGHGGTGTGACNLYASSGSVSIIQNSILTVGRFAQTGLTVTNRASGAVGITTPLLLAPVYSSAAAYTQTGIVNSANFTLARSGSPTDITIDDVSIKHLTAAHPFATYESGSANVTASVGVTCATASRVAGVVLGLDSTTNPKYFVCGVFYRNVTTNRVVLFKVVNGSVTSLISNTVTYGAGQSIKVVKSGTSLSLYYNNVQIGATQTLSSPADNLIINGTRHGMVSTSSDVSLDNFSLMVTA